MVRQGDLIKVSFNPQQGHEQAGYRPALVVSNDEFNMRTNMAIVCPVTNTDNGFPLHVPLDSRTETSGFVLCEHIRTLDLNARHNVFVEKIPDDLLRRVTEIIRAEVELI
ncbi:MAG: type II toxin-antitoxin system PemK/MazF family toxin [Clostridiales bacterium]|nr:type II toxin-antitoxin system PemK/MazF family toxin [Clostridiales bacterium]